jgi:hypothetical protein
MNQPNQELEDFKKELIFQPLNSAEELRDWMYLYFDLYFPMGVVYPTSTHGPVEAMWRIYELFKTGESAEVPQVCMLSSRDSYKTLCAAALEVLCMIHFRMPCCHMAAIESQSLKAVQYVESFFRKIKPYLEHNGWRKNSDNKRMIEWITETGVNIYLKIIVCTISGANCVDKNSLIHTDRGFIKAKDLHDIINSGEVVRALCFNHSTNEKEYKIIKKSFTSVKSDIYTVETDKGHKLKTSGEHKIFCLNLDKYLTCDSISLGTEVMEEQV